MVVVRRIGPRRVGLGVLAWAVVVDACVFVRWTGAPGGIARHDATLATLLAAAITVLAGLWLGWRHRLGTAFAAPWLAWVVLVPFAFASAFIDHGFLGGLWHGFLDTVFAGFVATVLEGLCLVAFATLGRLASAASGRSRRVVILPPVR